MAARHRADRKTRRVGRVTRHDAAVSRPNVLSLSLSFERTPDAALFQISVNDRKSRLSSLSRDRS